MQNDAHLAELLQKELAPFADNIQTIVDENNRLRAENEALKQQLASGKPDRKNPTPELTEEQVDGILAKVGIYPGLGSTKAQPAPRSSAEKKIDDILNSVL